MRLGVPGFFSGIGLQELVLILVVALILFGHRLPEVARSIGKGYREFRKGLQDLQARIETEDAELEGRDRAAPPPGFDGRGGTAEGPKAAGEAPSPGFPSGEPRPAGDRGGSEHGETGPGGNA